MLQDIKRTKDTIFEAKKLVEAGGDWDRRNRLKVPRSGPLPLPLP